MAMKHPINSLVLVVVLGWLFPAELTVGDEKAESPEERSRREIAADLAGLHAAAAKYVEAEGEWPQMPGGEFEGTEEEFYAFWKKALKPYGATEAMWTHSSEAATVVASYVPTLFSKGKGTAYRWQQPWFAARSSFGLRGVPYFVMPDGSISNQPPGLGKGPR